MSKAKLKTKSATPRRVPKVLSDPLYCYVEPGNGSHARTEGKKIFGSFSAYVNALIAKDRGVAPKLGDWKSKGEAKKLRTEGKKKPTKVSKVKPGKKKSAGKKSQSVSSRKLTKKKEQLLSKQVRRKSTKKISLRPRQSKAPKKPKFQKTNSNFKNLTKAQLIQRLQRR